MLLNFKNHKEAQDMIGIIKRDKGLSTEKAIDYAITQYIYNKLTKAGYASIAISLWDHDDPDREWFILENPHVEVHLEKYKEQLVETLMEKENIDIETAVTHFLIFNMDELGYHI